MISKAHDGVHDFQNSWKRPWFPKLMIACVTIVQKTKQYTHLLSIAVYFCHFEITSVLWSTHKKDIDPPNFLKPCLQRFLPATCSPTLHSLVDKQFWADSLWAYLTVVHWFCFPSCPLWTDFHICGKGRDRKLLSPITCMAEWTNWINSGFENRYAW